MRIVTLLGLALLSVTGAWGAAAPAKILFSVELASSQPLTLASQLPLKLTVVNSGPSRSCVFGNLTYFVTARVFDELGAEVFGPVNVESVPPPPRSSSQFVCLEPQHFFGATSSYAISDLGITLPGSYRLMFTYFQSLSSKSAFGLPVWRGSTSVTLSVTVAQQAPPENKHS